MERADIITTPEYWIEDINGKMYDAMIRYMQENKMTKKDLARHLGISASRLSQILNSGDMNFSIEKIIEISLKINKIPLFLLEDKEDFLNKEKRSENAITIFNGEINSEAIFVTDIKAS